MKTPRTLGAIALASLGGLAASQTTEPVVPTGAPHPASFWWSDFDADGNVDALVLQPAGRVRLLAGQGDGSFQDVTVRVGLADVDGVTQALWQDVDADGRAELYLVRPEADSRLLRLAGASFVDVTGASGLELGARVRFGEWIDVDADGLGDLHLSTDRGELLLRNRGGAGFEELDLGVSTEAPGWSPELVGWTSGGGATDRPEDARETGASHLAATPGPSVTSTTQTPDLDPASSSQACGYTMYDQATGNCLTASSVPTVGALFPLGQDFNIDFAGRVGIGTLTPGAALDVVGTVRTDQQLVSTASSGPPIAVSSSAVVANLNADMIDGMHASELNPLGTVITTGEIANNAITLSKMGMNSVGSFAIRNDTIRDEDVNAAAAISGTKILPDFGGQDVSASGAARFGKDDGILDPYGVAGEGQFDTRGFLGVQGGSDFDGFLSVDISGREVGVLGLSVGASISDNYGVLGQSNNAGVRGQHDSNPTVNYGELGVAGAGVRGNGSSMGGHFTSDSVAGQFTSGYDGVRAETDDSGGYGVWGLTTSFTGPTRAILGQAESNSGHGVHGFAASSTGTTYGVYGHAVSTSGRGVRGHASSGSGTNFGVWGTTNSTSGRGMRGEAYASSGTTYGVQGRVYSPDGYGIISYGDSGSTGQKNFIQPHPTDPSLEIRFTSLEGNESGTYFRGSAALVGGRVELDVPEEFRLVSEAEGLTVQLTPRGPGADLWVESVDLDGVTVRGAWDVEFDYQVNGVRRGFSEHRPIRTNHAFVPEERGVPYGTQYPDDLRRILVENGTLNADFTPNEATAAALGWQLADPLEEAAREAEAAEARRQREAEVGAARLERERAAEAAHRDD